MHRLSALSLYAAVDCPAGAAGEALSRLREDGILREVRGDLEFRNELIRAQAYYAVAAPARQHLHRRVAELLAARPTVERKTLDLEIAWHCVRGGDLERAFVHGLSGAEEALRVGAPYEAEQILLVLNRDKWAADVEVPVALLLCRALLDQSKAKAVTSLLDEIVNHPKASARELAEAHRMEATAQYLMSPETGEKCCEAADRALSAARQLCDVLMTSQALFESARAGAEFGQEQRVRAALSELLQLLAQPASTEDPGILYALGFCYFFFFEIRSAADCLERAIRALASSPNSVLINHVYNGYGMSKHYQCEFSEAESAYSTALRLAQEMGDGWRSSIIASNLSTLRCIQGDYQGSIEFARYSVKAAGAGGNQPRISAAYANLAEAHILSGNVDKALDHIESARLLLGAEKSWRARVAFLVCVRCLCVVLV